jgi:hypothetical protein
VPARQPGASANSGVRYLIVQNGSLEQLIVILGCPRSGTTWLHGMLAEHPRVAGLGETYLFSDYVAVLRKAYASRWRPYVGLDKVLGEEGFRGCLEAFATAALQRVAEERPGVRVLVEKTPANALVWREIRELFPDAVLIHVLRDPRDVVCSLRAAGRSWGRSWAPTNVAGAARFWRLFVENALGVENDPRGLVVRYEALQADGAAELARIGRAAGLDVDPEWCRQVAANHSFERRAQVDGAGPDRFLRSGRAGSWREDLSRRDVRAVEYIAGALMDRLGYPRSVPSARGKPFGLSAYDLAHGVGSALHRRARLLYQRSLRLLPGP